MNIRPFFFLFIIIGLIQTRKKGKMKWSLSQYIYQIIKNQNGDEKDKLAQITSCFGFVSAIVRGLCEKKEAESYLSPYGNLISLEREVISNQDYDSRKNYKDFGYTNIQNLDRLVQNNKDNNKHLLIVLGYFNTATFDHFQIIEVVDKKVKVYQTFQNYYNIVTYLKSPIELNWSQFLNYLQLFMLDKEVPHRTVAKELFGLNDNQFNIEAHTLQGLSTLLYSDISGCQNDNSECTNC